MCVDTSCLLPALHVFTCWHSRTGFESRPRKQLAVTSWICFPFPDAEEEENQPQFEPSSGSAHRLGDGLPRTPATLCIDQVRPLVQVQSFLWRCRLVSVIKQKKNTQRSLPTFTQSFSIPRPSAVIALLTFFDLYSLLSIDTHFAEVLHKDTECISLQITVFLPL